MSPSPPSPTRSAPAAEPTQQARVVVPAPLTATFAGGAIGLATADGQLAVQVPLDLGPWSLEEPAAGSGEAATATTTATSMATSTATSTGALAAVSVACLLDTALARRLYRRVSAWRRDSDGHLTARVRPSA